MASGSSTKRKRIDVSDTTEPANNTAVTRSDIWFEDGNIILQAQMLQFRVHRGVIGRHSTVFKDMFAMPQPTGEHEIEGCAVVHVMDSRLDWENILVILYDSLKAYKSTDEISFSMLESMLRLGRKYEFDHLRDLAMECLASELPRTLASWEKQYNKDDSRNHTIACHPFDLINLLIEFEIRSVLPSALYACIEDVTLAEILQGTSRADGTMVHLSPDTQMTLIVGKEKLTHSAIKYIHNWFNADRIEDCRKPQICNTARAIFLNGLFANWDIIVLFAPFLLQKFQAADVKKVFCNVCIPLIRDRIVAGRVQAWTSFQNFLVLQSGLI